MSSYWERYARRRLGRRPFLTGTVGLTVGAAGLITVGCGGDDKSSDSPGTQPTTGATPKTGGTVKIGHPTLQPWDTLDPLFNSFLGTYVILQNLREAALMEFDDKLRPTAGLAQKWEISPDGLEYVFTLRDGAKFHDGSPVDSEAVKWSLDRHKKENPKYPPAARPPVVLPTRVDAVDPKTVKLTLARPYPALLQDLTHIELGTAVSKTAHSRSDDPYGYESGIATKPITAGAFSVQQFTSKQSMVLGRFADYWGGAPYLERIEAKPVPEDGTRVTLIKTGEADIISNVPPQDIDDLKSDKSLVVDSRPGQKVLNIIVNMLKPPFGPGPDPKAIAFRQAVAYAIDRKSIVQNILRGQGDVADSPLIPAQFGFKSKATFSFDQNRAKQLLAEAGWDRNYKPKLFVGEGFATAAKEVAQAVQAMLKEVGIDADLEVWGDYGAMVNTVLSKQPDQYSKWDLNFNSWSMLPEPSSRISQILHGTTGLVSYNSQVMDSILDKQLYEVNDEKRASLLGEVQDLAMKELPYIPMYYQYYSHAWRKNLQGVRVQDSESYDLRKAWLS